MVLDSNKTARVVHVLEKIREDKQRHHEERMAKSAEALSLLKTLVEKTIKLLNELSVPVE